MKHTLVITALALAATAALAQSTPRNTFRLASPGLTVKASVPAPPVETASAHGSLVATSGVSFGSVVPGTSASLAFSFSNTGGAPATGVFAQTEGQAVTLSSNSCGTLDAPVTLEAGGTCSVVVTWTPQSAGVLSQAVVRVFSSSTNGTQALALSGIPQVTTGVNFASLGNGAVPLNAANTAFYGPTPYNYVPSNCIDFWTVEGMLCAGNTVPAQSYRLATHPSSWPYGSATTWRNSVKGEKYLVVDLGQVRTFNKAYFYQANSDGLVTDVSLAVHHSPVGWADTGWVPLGSRAIPQTALYTTPQPLSFAPVSARYVRVGASNSGTVNSNYVELHGLQLFME